MTRLLKTRAFSMLSETKTYSQIMGLLQVQQLEGMSDEKKVERSYMDTTMLVVTYSCEHNHPWPTFRNHHSMNKPVKPKTVASAKSEPKEKFTDLGDESSLMVSDEFSWFGNTETTSSTVLESLISAKRSLGDADMVIFFPMSEEDELLYADLGELSECSIVFRGVGPQLEIY